jgi:type IV pilus assembly protein PilO
MHPTVEKVLKLPNKQKIALLCLVLLLEGAAFYYGFQQPKYQQLKGLQVKLNDLQNQIQENTKIANNLPRLKKEYEQLQVELASALTELPK